MASTPGRFLAKGVFSNLRATIAIRNQQSKRYIQQQQPSSAATNETDKYSYFTPTEGFVRTSQFDPVTVPDVALDKYVWADLVKWENKIAVTCVVTGRQYTYAQLRDHCAALAVRLQQKFKLNLRDVLAVCLPNLPEFPIAVLGSIEAGLTVTTVNPVYTAEDIARQLENSNSKFVICTVAGFSTVREACKLINKRIPICCVRTSHNDSIPEGALDFSEISNPKNCDFSQLKVTDVDANETILLPYSSGTTGLPKGVELSHRNITVNCEMIQTRSPYPPLLRDTTDSVQEVVPGLLPFFHIYGLSIILLSKLRQGMHLVTMPKFTPDDLIKSLYDYKGTALYLVPPIVLFLTHSPKVEPKHLEHLRIAMSGAAPLGGLDAEKFMAKHPHVHLFQGYGMTETSPVIMLGHTGCKKSASVGFVAASTEAKVASYENDNRTGLGPHSIGEICVRGPQVMKGYLNNREATDDIFLPGNWMRTGDVGYYDEDGYFFITDRMKELIKVKGFQVAPAELEELLRDHPKIIDAAIIGVPHDQFGEVPRAFIVLRPGTEATEKEIQDYVASKVVVYKRLDGGVVILPEIPKNASGKIMRRELKAKYC